MSSNYGGNIYQNNKLGGIVDHLNSSSNTLGVSEVFTGLWRDVCNFSQLTLLLSTSHDSAASGLQMQFSTDATNVDRSKNITVAASNGSVHTLVHIAQYFRVVYTNGITPQTHFRLQVIHHYSKSKELTSTLTQTITDTIDVQNTRSIIAGKQPDGTYDNIQTDDNGSLRVNSGNENIFGTSISVPYNVVVSSWAPYGVINDQLYTPFTASGGTVVANNNGVEVDYNITTTIGSYAILRSRRVLKYRPGFSNIVRTSARFNVGVANSLQFSGVGNASSDLYFCMSGTDFGVRRSTAGLTEIRVLDITNEATGVETATITLNGVVFTASLTDAGVELEPFTAHEVEVGDTYTGWKLEHIGNKIIFQASSVGDRPGVYSFSSTGTATGTFSQTKQGAALSTTFISQSSWNGSSPMVSLVDATKNNLYQIEYSWFGSSNIVFSVYNPGSARFETVHTMTFANTGANVSLTQPNMFIQNGLASLGSTTAMSLTSTCSMGATLGPVVIELPIHSVEVLKSITSSSETNLIVMKNRDTINEYSNQSECYITRITIVNDGNKALKIKLYKDPTSVSADTTSDYTNYQYVNEENSLLIYDTNSLTKTGGDILDIFYINKNGSLSLEFDKTLEFFQSEIILLTGESTAISDVSVSVSFIDDF
jgi:hypothetical protein